MNLLLPSVTLADERSDFILRNLCPVERLIGLVHDRAYDASRTNRFFIIALPYGHRSGGYVQCLVDETDLLCEAESGLMREKPGMPRSLVLSASQIALLAEAGFREIRPKRGNYQQEMTYKPGDYRPLATMLLGVLKDVYGADVTTPVELKGNSVRENEPILYRDCRPIS